MNTIVLVGCTSEALAQENIALVWKSECEVCSSEQNWCN